MDAILAKDNIPTTLARFGAVEQSGLIAVSQILRSTLQRFAQSKPNPDSSWLHGLCSLAQQARHDAHASNSIDEEELNRLERTLCEMWYIYHPDWKIQGSSIVAEKGTWLKKSTKLSWDAAADEVMHYVPIKAVIPFLKISNVADAVERNRHQYSKIHRRLWVHPEVIKQLDDRLHCFYIYWPHWTLDVGGSSVSIIANQMTYLKRSTGMSWDLQPWEMILCVEGQRVVLAERPCAVTEAFEKNRHKYVHEHRRVRLDKAPRILRGEKYSVIV